MTLIELVVLALSFLTGFASGVLGFLAASLTYLTYYAYTPDADTDLLVKALLLQLAGVAARLIFIIIVAGVRHVSELAKNM